MLQLVLFDVQIPGEALVTFLSSHTQFSTTDVFHSTVVAFAVALVPEN
jgi:hypothetical protein